MNNYIKKLTLLLITLALFVACSKDVPTRVVFPNSTPIIESVSITPNPFTFGDSISITATVSDPITPLSTLRVKIVVEDQIIDDLVLRTAGKNATVESKFYTPLINNLPSNSTTEIFLNLTNVEGDFTTSVVNDVIAQRPDFDVLYLITDNNDIIVLERKLDSYSYINNSINIKGGSISYKIASQLTNEGEIDYTGFVWASDNGTIKVMGDKGVNINTIDADIRVIKEIEFNVFNFTTILGGEMIDPNNIVLNPEDMSDDIINGIMVKNITLNLTNGQELIIDGDLLDEDVYFEYNYFEKIEDDKIKFLGENGTWNIYFGVEAKNVLVQNANNYSYPQAYLVCGAGLGYPSYVANVASITWNFKTVYDCIPFKNIGDNKFQAMVYFNAEIADFKPFENDGWGGELKANEFIVPSIIDNSDDSGNWKASENAVSGVYIFTLDVQNKIMEAELVGEF